MSLIVLLDAGPLGMITNPKSSPENEACKNWLASLAYNAVEVMIPEIAGSAPRVTFGPARTEGLAIWTR